MFNQYRYGKLAKTYSTHAGCSLLDLLCEDNEDIESDKIVKVCKGITEFIHTWNMSYMIHPKHGNNYLHHTIISFNEE